MAAHALAELATDIKRRKLERMPKAMDPNVLDLKCNIWIELRGPDGELKEPIRHVHNLIVTAGKNKLLEVAAGILAKDFKYMAIGTGVTAANAADTALQTEVARSVLIVATNPTAPVLQFVNTFAAGTGTGAITEVGMLSAASAGVLLNRTVFAVINKGAGDALTMTVQIS